MKKEAYDGLDGYPLLSEPNQAFTPRQILEQFARNELSAKIFDPSDMIDSDNYSDDQMVDGVVDFEDEFEATQFMKETKVVKDEPKKNESVSASDDGDKESSDEVKE